MPCLVALVTFPVVAAGQKCKITRLKLRRSVDKRYLDQLAAPANDILPGCVNSCINPPLQPSKAKLLTGAIICFACVFHRFFLSSHHTQLIITVERVAGKYSCVPSLSPLLIAWNLSPPRHTCPHKANVDFPRLNRRSDNQLPRLRAEN